MPKHEPKPASKAPSCPSYLKGEAAKEWKRIVPLLLELGLLAQIDRAQLAAYCSAWDLFVRADREVVDCDPIEYTEKGYPVQTPWIAIRRNASEELRSLAGHFGMSPMARSRISLVLSGDKAKSDSALSLDAILNG